MLYLMIILPILGLVLEKYFKTIYMIIAILELYLSIYLFIFFNNNNIEMKERTLYFGIDSINLPLILLTTIIIPIVLLIRDIYNNENILFQRIIIIIEFSLIFLLLVNDIFYFFIFFEILLIPMFIIIIKYGSRFKKIEAGYKYVIYTIIGSLLFILSIILIYNLYNTTNNEIIQILMYEEIFNIKLIIWILFFFSFAIKIPIFPFHIWLPMAHTEAPATGSVILAAILLKIGVFGFLRYSISILGLEVNMYLSPIVITLCLISIIYSLFIIYKIIDIKKIIAYSSIIHMNYLLIGIYVFEKNSVIGSYYTVISHGIISAGLFILIGIIYRRYHTRNIIYIKGLSNVLPIFSMIYFIFIISNMSIPLTSSFPGEFLILLGVYKGSIIISIILILLLLVSTGYNMLLINKVIFGNISTHIKKYRDITLNEILTLIPLIIINIILGIFTNPLINIYILPFTKIFY